MRHTSRRLGALLLIPLCLILSPTNVVAGNSRFFPETGQTSSNAFYDFWIAHGQIAILGLPISPTFRWPPGDGHPNELVIQVYERAVLEWHPENAPQDRVQLARLGDALLDLLQADQPGQRLGALLHSSPPDPCDDPLSCITFSETNHTLRGAFLAFWDANGGLAAFGYPLTEQFDVIDPATGEMVTEQYFERSRLEYHLGVDGGTILLGLLGSTFWDLHQEVVLAHPEAFVTVPDLSSTDRFLPAPELNFGNVS